MKKTVKRLFGSLLAFCLVLNLLPAQVFADEGDVPAEPVEQEEVINEEVEAVKPEKIKITLTFTGIYNTNGTIKTSSQSNTLSKGVGWNVTEKKFHNMVTYKNFSNQGIKYIYTNQWAYEDGTIVTFPLQFKYDDFSEDTNIIVHPIYDIIEPARLNFYKVDNISTASGSWSNTAGSFGTYTCTFKQPEAQPHYLFVYWEDAETGMRFSAGEKMSVTEASIGSGNTKDVYVYATYQPSVTVNYHDMDGQLISSNESFEAIDAYSFNAPEVSGYNILGWSESANGSIISSATRYEVPVLTTERVSQKIHDLYAVYSTSYKVEHYIEELDGSYTLKDAESFEDIIYNAAIQANAKDYEGFTLNSSSETEAYAKADLVLKLYYDRNSYSVNYEYENAPENAPALPEAAEYKFGSDVQIAAAEQIEGYTFSGWDKEDFQMPAEDVTIKGSYNINTYKITWLNEDGSILEEDLDVEYGSMPSYDGEAPVKNADDKFTYEFDSWNEEIAAVTQDMTYTAKFKATAIPAAEEPVVEDPVIEEPVIEEPVIEEPIIEEPVEEEPTPVIEEPVIEEPIIEEPVIEEPVVVEPVIEEPVIEEPVIEEPIVEEPTIVEPAPVAEEPAVVPAPVVEYTPAPSQPAYEEPAAVEEVVIEESVVEIEEVEVPMAAVTEEIADVEAPLTEARASWALANLLAAIATVIATLAMYVTYFKKQENDEEEENEDREENSERKTSKLLSIIPAAVSVILFILTEDMRNPMVLFDKWTLLMMVIMIGNLVVAYLTRNKEEESEEEENQLEEA